MHKTLRLSALTLTFALGACTAADPATATLINAYPITAEPDQQVTVYKSWWFVTEFAEPVAAGQSSDSQRVVPGDDYAYALLAPGWDAASSTPPTRLIAVRSLTSLRATHRHGLQISISPSSFAGDCSTGQPLTQTDADFITQRIFPADFQGLSYDAATCTTSAAAPSRDGSLPAPLTGSLDASSDAAH